MPTPQPADFPRLAVMGDPDVPTGLHPYHDHRWIVTEGAQIEHGHDPRSDQWGIARHSDGYLVAQMRDLDPRLTREIVRRHNAFPAILEALQYIATMTGEDDTLETAVQALKKAGIES